MRKDLPSNIDLEIDAIGAANSIRNQGWNMALDEVLVEIEK